MVCTWIGLAPGFVTALPVRSALAVAGRPVCDPGTVARRPKPTVSAVARRTVPKVGTGLARSTGRRRRGVPRALDRPRPWVVRRTDCSPGAGQSAVPATSFGARFSVVPASGPGVGWSVLPVSGARALGIGGTVRDCRSNQYRSHGRTGRIHVPAMDTMARVVSASQPGAAAADRRAGRPSPSDRPGARRPLLSTSVVRSGFERH
jgi:hypothetical protein